MKDNSEALPPNSGTELGEVLDFMRLLWAVDHGLRSTSKRMGMRLGITGPQRLVVRIVGRYPNISAGQLADILHVHPSTLTGVLSRLEASGLIERKSDPDDGRRALFALTEKGLQYDATNEGTVESAIERALNKLPPKKVATTKEILAALAKELE